MDYNQAVSWWDISFYPRGGRENKRGVDAKNRNVARMAPERRLQLSDIVGRRFR
jgi:hypothetical protein